MNPRHLPTRHLWQYRTTIATVRRSFYGKTAAEARRKGEDAARADALGLRLGGSVGDWLESWLEDLPSRVKPATYRRYRGIARTHLLPALGAIPLDRLTAADVIAMESRMTKVAPATVRHAHVVLGTALQAAVAQGRMIANPVRSVKPPRVTHRDKVILSRADAAKLLAAAKGDPFEALYVLALTAGMREGEILALRWRDVDLDAGTVSVTATVVRDVNGDLTTDKPKTRAGRRTLPISDRALAVLAEMERGKPGEFLFTSATGLVSPQALLRQHFYPLLDRAELPRMRFHDLRHTAATHLLEDGVPILAVANLLGHASVAVTMGIYAHLTPRMTGAATAAMNARYPA
jgi:integrase